MSDVGLNVFFFFKVKTIIIKEKQTDTKKYFQISRSIMCCFCNVGLTTIKSTAMVMA